MGTAIKQIAPACRIYAVEPRGADVIARSLSAGAPQRLESVKTVADTLAVPFALPISFDLCFRSIDEIVLVDDLEIEKALVFLFTELKLALEPAGATSTAGLLGPLRGRVAGKRVGVIICGANIDSVSFSRHLASGSA